MRGPLRGASLIELLVALTLLGLSLAPAALGVALAFRESTRATLRIRAAGALLDRTAALRAQAGRTDPPCLDLASGTSGGAEGLEERWEVESTGALRRLRVRAGITRPGIAIADSLEVMIRCG